MVEDGARCLKNNHADKDTYSASAEDIEVQSCFLDDQLTNLSPPRNCMPPDVPRYVNRDIPPPPAPARVTESEKAVSSKPCPSIPGPMFNGVLRVGSIEPLENPLDTRKLESSSYHALGACLRPYNAFFRRSLRNAVLTSIWYTVNDLCAAYAMNSRTASNRATGANDSSKSIPSF
ncbi:hypothetical protein Tco_0875371 [Tanacetum coccineum]|uniref:Uncharacterized protein n=1 Tax=Tanacetum coccineum TaxID=301880 RepID=A0ABQ5BPE1_9ASTR